MVFRSLSVLGACVGGVGEDAGGGSCSFKRWREIGVVGGGVKEWAGGARVGRGVQGSKEVNRGKQG